MTNICRKMYLAWQRIAIPKEELRFRTECKNRPLLNDAEFVMRYYRNKSIPSQIPIRVRRVLGQQLGVKEFIPQDNICAIFQDLDLLDIAKEMTEEFGVLITASEICELDGTFDSLVLFFNKKICINE